MLQFLFSDNWRLDTENKDIGVLFRIIFLPFSVFISLHSSSLQVQEFLFFSISDNPTCNKAPFGLIYWRFLVLDSFVYTSIVCPIVFIIYFGWKPRKHGLIVIFVSVWRIQMKLFIVYYSIKTALRPYRYQVRVSANLKIHLMFGKRTRDFWRNKTPKDVKLCCSRFDFMAEAETWIGTVSFLCILAKHTLDILKDRNVYSTFHESFVNVFIKLKCKKKSLFYL